MIWSLKAGGKKASWLEKLREEQGIKIKTLENRPRLYEDLEWIWEAFRYCSVTRDLGIEGIPQRIKVSEIKAYCEILGIADEDQPFLMRCVLNLDEEFISIVMKQREQEARKAQRKGQRRRGR